MPFPARPPLSADTTSLRTPSGRRRARRFGVAAAALVVALAGCTPPFVSSGAAGSPTPTPTETQVGTSTPPPSETPTVVAPPTVTVTAQAKAPTSEPTRSSEPTTAAPTPAGWEGVLADVRPQLVRIATAGCGGPTGMGSGFVVGPDLIVTAAHVIDEAVQVNGILDDGPVVPLSVVGADSTRDVALLRSAEPLKQDGLQLADAHPSSGTELAIIGYPLSTYNLHISTGIVSGLGEPVTYPDGQVVSPVFQTDAATNGGNSGGPVVDRSGTVIGLVSGSQVWSTRADDRVPVQGINFIVPSSAFGPLLQQWRTQPTPPAPTCPGDADIDESSELNVTFVTEEPIARELGLILFTHGAAINVGQYSTAFDFFTPAAQQRLGGLATWSAGLRESYWVDLTIGEAFDYKAATVEATLRTLDVGTERVCKVWSLDYEFEWIDGKWLIDDVRRRAPEAGC
ncbi:S1-C subfamily serine protease [Kineosphaera limosa]|uniref:Putative peptidase S1 family protein n=1 Tax=Kineosphaera limosa NBRC 100340 TaxID=1184609 RepID=K6WVS0_9MICO|nr:trypsin-like peptidase domain-containing protein [Kineosphaera limosa]NYE00414.1 S1-C subfamily serine protease [Kineosphaera limosa]GAB97916.1 putative peptidase S1 family protein [Kineosphaera limosa NBRC 100340]